MANTAERKAPPQQLVPPKTIDVDIVAMHIFATLVREQPGRTHEYLADRAYDAAESFITVANDRCRTT